MTVATSRRAPSSDRRADAAPAVLYVQAPGYPRQGLADRLARLDVTITIAVDVAEALRLLAERRFVSVIVDLANERLALTSIRLIRARHPELPMAGVVEPANPLAAAEAMQAGVFDLLPWPFETAVLASILAGHRDRGVSALATEDAPGDEAFDWFLASRSMRGVLEAARAAASVRHGVAVSGEVGSGHEVVARAIHAMSGDAREAYVEVECGQAGQDVERQLFGNSYERHDVSGLAAERVSDGCALLRAAQGTVFVGNLVEAPARVQARLARLLRDREAMTDGGQTIPLDVRLVTGLGATVDAAVSDGRLRRDLADRLVSRLDLPSLRHRREDIPRLAAHYLQAASQRHGLGVRHFSRSALTLLAALPWPQNTRELEGLVETSVCAARGSVVQLEDVLAHAHLEGVATRVESVVTLREARMRFERECITAALLHHRGRVGEAAKALGIQRTNLYRKVRQLKLDKALLSTHRA